ncbi:MAG: tRNA s(4)U8 sulfurtransferase [Candidatus Methanofastidiosum methylothiophilum]|uniref:tRNA s(4)U8 sulfurtransferase n=1 Tax=Candidatus Methanofastidiosum methylothiophilum TaxID=1705564 RepID=A0A150IXR2_9EURY|nr:MAG: tRNA s(4)U8 sulfurtransferase [Candidatus Methanofastidiosum methylthiophilus]NMC77430.1 RNA-binding protein [Candidatus Methanofastidiosa archaeon]
MEHIKEFLLVTTPTARQFDGIWEVEWALEGEVFEIKKTKFKGVLLVKCRDAKKAAEMIRDYETCAIHRAIPFDRYVNTDKDLILVEATDVAVSKISENDSFAVRCKKRGKANFKSQDLEREVGAKIVEAKGAKVNLEDPDIKVIIQVIDKKTGISVLRKDEIIRKDVLEEEED